MKNNIIFALLFFFFSKASALGLYQPVHLLVNCFPLDAGIICTASSVYVDEYGFYNNESNPGNIENILLNASLEEFMSEIDTCYITYQGMYEVRAIPCEGYQFVGFSHATYVGYKPDVFDYSEEYYVTVSSSDFVFDIDTSELFFNRYTDNSVAFFFANQWATGWIFTLEEGYDCPEDPNEYCYALFCRVKAEAEGGGKAEIDHRVNEIGDEITITATPDDDSSPFLYWIEESTGRKITENPYTFTVTGMETYTAHFGDPSVVVLPQSSPQANSIYDLQGRQLKEEPVHGIYIKGGKKIVR